ncbi:MAG TPA: pilus assembly PilX N-terminal domain-containing protein [Thermoanaerobaculia bacterium]
MKARSLQSASRRQRSGERGAALILTVIVIMVLTTLGIAMVTFTTTEERTATTYRDAMQVRAVAEGGIRVVQEMFRSPQDRNLIPLYSATGTSANAAWDYWGANEAAVETNLNAIGIWRAVRAGASPARYTGTNDSLFSPPFRTSWANVFGGAYSPTAISDVYDLKFNCTDPSDATSVVASSSCWLDSKLNAMLSASSDFNLDTGRISDISFYAPPMVNNKAYGIATVRVTAEKRDASGGLMARETLIAIIGDATPTPSILGNGNVDIGTTGNRDLCGDGCEQIHANGNISISPNISGGEDPMVSATGSVTGTSTSINAGASFVEPPEINPWDLTYKPSVTAELAKYYLVTARRLDAAWRDGDASTKGSAPRPCGNGGLARCQDYNLEYATDNSAKPARTATDTPYMYRWNNTNSEWDECSSGTSLSAVGACTGGPTFSVARVADEIIGTTTDNADIPFNKFRVPKTTFEIQSAQDGATVLVDGKFYKHGNLNATMSVIAAGSIHLHSNTTWYPALSSKVMWLAGRDIYFHSDCCAPTNNVCADPAAAPAYSGVIAAHEQIKGDSNNSVAGIVIAENRVNHDTLVNTATLAIDLPKMEHVYLCGQPDWPWAMPTTPVILAIMSAAN